MCGMKAFHTEFCRVKLKQTENTVWNHSRTPKWSPLSFDGIRSINSIKTVQIRRQLNEYNWENV